jgi:nicotinamidase-related amidase
VGGVEVPQPAAAAAAALAPAMPTVPTGNGFMPPRTTHTPANGMSVGKKVHAEPFEFPLVGDLDPQRTCLLVLDFQNDYVSRKGFFHSAGRDIQHFARPLPRVAEVLQLCRNKGFRVCHGRQGFRPDLADVTPYITARYNRNGMTIGTLGPLGRFLVRGEPGSDIHPDVAPLSSEPVIDRSADSALVGTELDMLLRGQGVDKIIVCGRSLTGAVYSTLRHAADLGYQSLLLCDCCGGFENSQALARVLEAVGAAQFEGGSHGVVATSTSLIDALNEPASLRQTAAGMEGSCKEKFGRASSPLPASLLLVPALPRTTTPRRLGGMLPPRPATCDPAALRSNEEPLED